MVFSGTHGKHRAGLLGNDRGIALLIVLLITALLIALVFEFAYATRISMNSTANFRDSQRAYFLAEGGINIYKKYAEQIRKVSGPGEWFPLPLENAADTAVLTKWEDESGKIKINDIRDPGTREAVKTLFDNKQVDPSVLTRITDPSSEIGTLAFVSGLRKFMGDDYDKIADFVTVAPVSMNMLKINVNTASREVLESLGINAAKAEEIIKERGSNPYTPADLTTTSSGRLSALQNIFIHLTTQSAGYYKISASGTVGGFTRKIEAILNGQNIVYWKSL